MQNLTWQSWQNSWIHIAAIALLIAVCSVPYELINPDIQSTHMINQLFLLVFYYVSCTSTGFFHKELYVACDSVFFIAGAGHCSSYISIHWNERCGWLADQCRIQHDNFGEHKYPYIGVSSHRVTIAFCRPVFHCSVAVCVCTVYGICDILGWHRLPLSHSTYQWFFRG